MGIRSTLFIDCIMLELESELQEYCAKEMWPVKLIIDNVPGHLTTIGDHCEHIKMALSPVTQHF